MVARTATKPQENTESKTALLPTKKKILAISCVVMVTVLLTSLVVTTQYLQSHLPLNTTIDGKPVGGLTLTEVNNLIKPQDISDFRLTIKVNQEHTATPEVLPITTNPNRVFDSISATLSYSPLSAWKWWLTDFKNPTVFITPYETSQEALRTLVEKVVTSEAVEGKSPSVKLKKSGVLGSLEVFAGTDGFIVDTAQATSLITEALHNRQSYLKLPLQQTVFTLSESESELLKKRAEAVVGHQVRFFTPDKSVEVTLGDQDFIKLLGIPRGINQEVLQALVTQWSKKIDRLPRDAVLDIEPESLTIKQFIPPLDGLVLDQNQLQQTIVTLVTNLTQSAESTPPPPPTSGISAVENHTASGSALTSLLATSPTPPASASAIPQSLELPLAIKSPNKPLSATNDLGISEKIGHGQSRYAHSIPSRIHNVALATSKVTDFIIKPGEEFSFNQKLGEVSAATGFMPAYIIRSGRTELGDGGGVCQVSTTLFRAAMNAGLPITKRRPHSYRVSYYELDSKPGIDATVYAGDVDLRFLNDTPNHILIHGQTDSQNLSMYYDIYGTSDGRVATITDHVTWGASPPAPTEYITDPSLPPGTKKQIDWSAPGLKAKFTYTVKTATGEVKDQQVFSSTYRPWSAKYLVGPTS